MGRFSGSHGCERIGIACFVASGILLLADDALALNTTVLPFSERTWEAQLRYQASRGEFAPGGDPASIQDAGLDSVTVSTRYGLIDGKVFKDSTAGLDFTY